MPPLHCGSEDKLISVPNHSLTVLLPPPLLQLRRDHCLLKGHDPPKRGFRWSCTQGGTGGTAESSRLQLLRRSVDNKRCEPFKSHTHRKIRCAECPWAHVTMDTWWSWKISRHGKIRSTISKSRVILIFSTCDKYHNMENICIIGDKRIVGSHEYLPFFLWKMTQTTDWLLK